MFTYDEHSGAGNTGWPQLNNAEPLDEQNRQYVGYMSKAKAEVDGLLEQGLSTLAQPSRYDSLAAASEDIRNVVVYNGLSLHPRRFRRRFRRRPKTSTSKRFATLRRNAI